MFDFSPFLERSIASEYREHFQSSLAYRCRPGRHGDLPAWMETVAGLPDLEPSFTQLDQDRITVGARRDMSSKQYQGLERGLRELAPWRKGPYEVFGCHIDTEWRSDWKWQRLAPYISPLTNRDVLDIGCGNGYHGWRMLGAGARYVLGIDPSMRFFVQFLALQKFIQHDRFDFLPLGIEDLPQDWPKFETVFSMGVIYHRRNPINHLRELFSLTKPGGEVVLETLIVAHADGGVLTPIERYAQMRNVWSILTVDKTLSLLHEAGFENARCVNENQTSLEEQRQTPWMQFHSLAEFLDPQDANKTIEGYPAPRRGIFIAKKPATEPATGPHKQ